MTRPVAPGRGRQGGSLDHKKVRTFTATSQDLEMLEAIARYHGFSKSATITSLIRKEFWRLFPAGNRSIRLDRGAQIIGKSDDR